MAVVDDSKSSVTKIAPMCTECGTSLFLVVVFILARSYSCNLYVALAALQLYHSPPAGGISVKTFNETLETS